MPILSLHHVTATVNDAQDDLDFCLGGWGLRLVKRTVNFDNHHVYHFYYGDERGTPGTIWTTFPYKGRGVPVGKEGAGQITSTAFSGPAGEGGAGQITSSALSVRAGTLEFWRARLAAHGVASTDVEASFGEAGIG